MDFKAKLALMYNDQSKHSNYQNIPDFVKKELGYTEMINESWRGDTARYRYLSREICFEGGHLVADIGANTGFFTLSLAYENPPVSFHAYEPNRNHASFIENIVEYFQMKNVVIYNKSIGLKELDSLPFYNTVLFLNILHHAGVDFDTDILNDMGDFKSYAIEYLRKLSQKSNILIFQMGYNWGGNKTKPIVPVNNIAMMVGFLADIFENSGWGIQKIAVHSWMGEQGSYQDLKFTQDLNPDNFKTDSRNSEFYNRPIFILKSKATEV